jgi:hypothetical protein
MATKKESGKKRGVDQVIKVGERKIKSGGSEKNVPLYARVSSATVKFFGMEVAENPTVKTKRKDGPETEVPWKGKKASLSIYAVVTEGEGADMKIKARKAIPFPSGCDEATMIKFLGSLKENTPSHYINRAGRMMQLPKTK